MQLNSFQTVTRWQRNALAPKVLWFLLLSNTSETIRDDHEESGLLFSGNTLNYIGFQVKGFLSCKLEKVGWEGELQAPAGLALKACLTLD